MKPTAEQNAENGGQNFFAQRDVVIHGTDQHGVIELCHLVWDASFPKYIEAARAEVDRRIELFGLKLIAAFARHGGPDPIENFSDPGLQGALLDALNGFARSGDEDLGDVLADILVQRSQQPSRSTLQLSLEAALLAAPKLTNEHYMALSFLLLVIGTRQDGFDSAEGLYKSLRDALVPLGEDLKFSESDAQYLQAIGCGSVNRATGAHNFSHILLLHYPGVFASGFRPDELEPYPGLRERSSSDAPPLIPCPRTPGFLQVNAVDNAQLEVIIESLDNEDEIAFVRGKFNAGARVVHSQIEKELSEFDPRFEAIIRNWDFGSIRSFYPTVTGITIGYANIRRLFGDSFVTGGLEDWIH